ncbi:metallophosphoesterase family protein [Paenibacillus elgii]|uniref:metallophosphoesterase family protein n=1 Tax=Paenibacillus elgii TaxID=189691 RepID=UPI00203EEC59|nr:metallophosphoesterase family protein [Paenibacillus elgii]MCM3268705.1 metallophosphoesterase [Paenibacillus elgii]
MKTRTVYETKIGPQLPDYMNAEMDRVVKRWDELPQEEALQLLFVTDLHHWKGGNQLRTARAIQELTRRLPLDAVVCGGDHSLNGPLGDFMESQREIMRELSAAACPVLPLKGNHDDNSIHDFYHHPGSAGHVVFPEDSFDLYVQERQDAVTLDPEHPLGLYYFCDIPEKRVRIVVLNIVDIPYRVTEKGNLQYNGQWKYAFSDRQLNWVAHKAFDFSSKADAQNWRVVLFSHASVLQEGVFGGDHGIENDEAMWGIMKAFRNGTAYRSSREGEFGHDVETDYSQQGPGGLIASFFGHVHFDQMLLKDDIRVISTLNAYTKQDFEEAPARTEGTITETAFDLITIPVRGSEGRVYLTRFGAGEDRVTDYRLHGRQNE